jgi:hypothetical protein
MFHLFSVLLLALAATAIIGKLFWTLRVPFWRVRHHDHLILPTPRSYRDAS